MAKKNKKKKITTEQIVAMVLLIAMVGSYVAMLFI